MTTIDLRGTPAAAATAEPRRVPLAVAGRELGWILGYLAVVAQLVLVLAALFLFHVEEDQGLLALGPLLLGGFAVHALLPRRWRRPFFLALSLAGLFAIVGLATGAAVLAAGLLLLGVCHLPIAWWARMTLLAGVAALLAALRLGHLPAPAAAQLALPVIASMFMFRLLLFLYDLRHQRAPSSPWTRLGYFFLLPNFSFLVFPVVGFGAFRRTWYDGEELAIYQKGLGWMLRGASHLVLYRVVAYYLMPTREAVHDLASLLQFLVTSYCQLLRISGQFHLAIGILCLFGWNLPRPQYLYFLASGFADYWRRANVYWRDFMVELFLYPAFQRLRRRGVAQPLFLATCWVFVATWLLHAWQWFWLLGRVRLGLVDALFWGAFGLAVAVNALLESRRRARPDPRAPRQCLRHAVKVLLTFAATCLLWSLWTSESVGAWLATLARGRVASPEQLAAVAAGVALLVGGGAAVTWTLRNRPAAEPAAPDSWRWRRAAVTGSAAAAFALLGFSPFQVRLPAPATQLLFSLTEARFAQGEADRARGGYYEELQETPRLSERHWFYRAKRWRDRRADPVVEQDGYLRRALRPSVSTVYQGKSFRSNAWGMRDRDYALRKAAGTFRIAVVGPSDAMGYGVADAEVFEHRLEERLSRDHAGGRWAAYEVLNHSIPGLGPLEMVHVVRDQALRFAPDLLLVVLHQGDERRAAQDLVRWHRLGLALPEHLRPHTAEIDLADTRPLRAAAQQIAGSGVDLVDWALGEIAGTARAAGARPVAVLFPNLAQSPDDEPLERIADTAARHGFLVVDLSGLFADERHEVLFATPWDHHPGAAAHARLAAALYEALRRHDPLLGAGLAAAPEDFAGGAP